MSKVSIQVWRRPGRVCGAAIAGAAAAAVAVLTAGQATGVGAATSTHGVDVAGIDRAAGWRLLRHLSRRACNRDGGHASAAADAGPHRGHARQDGAGAGPWG